MGEAANKTMPSEQLGEIFGRIHAGFRRTLHRGALPEDPRKRRLHERVRSLDPKRLTCRPLEQTRFVVIDTETTGLRAYAGDEICSISLLEMRGFELTGREYSTLINPGRQIHADSTAIHHLTNEDVRDAPLIEEAILDIVEFIDDAVLIGHHICFDIRFLNKTLQKELLCHLRNPWLDTMLLYLVQTTRVGHYTLDEVARHAGIGLQGRHTAHGDAMIAAGVFRRLASQLTEFANPVQKLIDRQYELGHF